MAVICLKPRKIKGRLVLQDPPGTLVRPGTFQVTRWKYPDEKQAWLHFGSLLNGMCLDRLFVQSFLLAMETVPPPVLKIGEGQSEVSNVAVEKDVPLELCFSWPHWLFNCSGNQEQCSLLVPKEASEVPPPTKAKPSSGIVRMFQAPWLPPTGRFLTVWPSCRTFQQEQASSGGTTHLGQALYSMYIENNFEFHQS